MEKLIAHRGLKVDGLKENSLASFQKALENENYGGFECDVRMCLDGVFVIHHNPIIKNDLISESSFQELQKKYNLPTLEEVLSLKSDKIFLLEIKDPRINVSSFLHILEKYPNKNIYLMSFHNAIIKKLWQKNRTYKLGILNYIINSEEDYQEYDFICLLEMIVSEKLIRYFHQKKIETFIYGVHHFDSTVSIYRDSYIITDVIKK